MLILDGKATAAETRASLKEEVASLLPRAGRAPGLAVILAGDDPASQVYVRNKEKAALFSSALSSLMNSGLAFLLLCSARLSVGPLPEKKLVHRIRLTKKDSRPKNFFAA